MEVRLSPTERIAARLVTTGMTAREVVELLAAHDAQVKAEAWDEGAKAGFGAGPIITRGQLLDANPYRAAEAEATR